MLSFCSKIHGVRWANEEPGSTQSLCCGRMNTLAVIPAPLCGSAAHITHTGDYCLQSACDRALGGPQRDIVLIRTNSSRQNNCVLAMIPDSQLSELGTV
jgi:hypothetical protein